MEKFRSGFANIIGYPNVGKSTLINKFLGEKLSIVTPKAQTTRQRIFGILSGKNYQIVFSDTPGILNPKYELQKSMIKDINQAYDDADIIIYMTDAKDDIEKHLENIEKIKKIKIPIYLIINKIDLISQDVLDTKVDEWEKLFDKKDIIPLSALYNFNITSIINYLKEKLPVHEPYFPEDIITDKSERYIASEIIREKIFLHYKQEIPYSVEVIVHSFIEKEKITEISADIIVGRKSQKPILIGKDGSALKRIGTEARIDMETFFENKVFLELFVKVRDNWRNNKLFLQRYGYNV
ncbi:MAG: GTPase Era [Bacteroidota bacterium]|nr:GTPase Era [Bacteroidota bacterium]